MQETIKSIIEWHEQTFPDATMEGQCDKFREELDEYIKEPSAYELADMFIVACGVARFDYVRAALCFSTVWEVYQKASFIFIKSDFDKAINEKMAKNRKRIWNKTAEGTYHHENGIED